MCATHATLIIFCFSFLAVHPAELAAKECAELEDECDQILQQATQAPARKAIMQQRDALQAELKKAKDTPGAYKLIGTIGEHLQEVKQQADQLPLSEMEYLTLVLRYTDLLERVEEKCKAFHEKEFWGPLRRLGDKFEALQALDLSPYLQPDSDPVYPSPNSVVPFKSTSPMRTVVETVVEVVEDPSSTDPHSLHAPDHLNRKPNTILSAGLSGEMQRFELENQSSSNANSETIGQVDDTAANPSELINDASVTPRADRAIEHWTEASTEFIDNSDGTDATNMTAALSDYLNDVRSNTSTAPSSGAIVISTLPVKLRQ